jgi:cathepsin L
VVIDGRGNGLQFYSGGIYNTTECSTITLNHAMLLVGYGTDTSSGRDYWILKNSWGTSWGIEGYIKFSRNRNNMCGIATAASYPVF